ATARRRPPRVPRARQGRPHPRRHHPEEPPMNLRTLTTTALTAAALTLGLTAPASADAITLSGDWNGDGTATTATYDRDRAWFTGAGMSFRYGRPGDLPLVGDWDGDGRDELGINRGKWMHLRTSLGPGIGDVS